jgi:hypothetical protein
VLSFTITIKALSHSKRNIKGHLFSDTKKVIPLLQFNKNSTTYNTSRQAQKWNPTGQWCCVDVLLLGLANSQRKVLKKIHGININSTSFDLIKHQTGILIYQSNNPIVTNQQESSHTSGKQAGKSQKYIYGNRTKRANKEEIIDIK